MPHPLLPPLDRCGALGSHAHPAAPRVSLRLTPIAAGPASYQSHPSCASHALLPSPRQQVHRFPWQRLTHKSAVSARCGSGSGNRHEEAAALDSSSTTEALSGPVVSLRLAPTVSVRCTTCAHCLIAYVS